MIKPSVRISVPPLDPEPGDDRAVDLGAGGQPLLRPLPGRDPRGRRPGVPDGGDAPPRRRLRRLPPHPLRLRRRIQGEQVHARHGEDSY